MSKDEMLRRVMMETSAEKSTGEYRPYLSEVAKQVKDEPEEIKKLKFKVNEQQQTIYYLEGRLAKYQKEIVELSELNQKLLRSKEQ